MDILEQIESKVTDAISTISQLQQRVKELEADNQRLEELETENQRLKDEQGQSQSKLAQMLSELEKLEAEDEEDSSEQASQETPDESDEVETEQPATLIPEPPSASPEVELQPKESTSFGTDFERQF